MTVTLCVRLTGEMNVVLSSLHVSRPGLWLVTVWLYLISVGGDRTALMSSITFWGGLIYCTYPLNLVIEHSTERTSVAVRPYPTVTSWFSPFITLPLCLPLCRSALMQCVIKKQKRLTATFTLSLLTHSVSFLTADCGRWCTL